MDADTVTVVVEDTTPPVVTANLVPLGKVGKEKGLFRVEFGCSDSCDSSPTVTLADLNGIPVVNGQVVELKIHHKTEVKEDKEVLTIKSPSFLLTVRCVDASENEGVATEGPVF